MAKHEKAQPAEDEPYTPRKCLTLFILGFSTIILGLILVAVAAAFSQVDSTGLGGIIFIGPIPIVFGAGPDAQWMILFAIIPTVLSVTMFLISRGKADSTNA
jgi:uncharacterized membrane protein